MCNAAHHRTPFNDHPVDIARAEKLRDPSMLAERIFVNALDHFAGAPTVSRRHAIFEITKNRLNSVNTLAIHGEAAAPTVFLLRETETRVEICEIIFAGSSGA